MFRTFIAVVCVFCLASCSSLPITFRVTSSKQLNTKTANISFPVRLKIYQLSDRIAFDEASFDELWKNDKSVLGEALLDKHELTVIPNTTKHFTFLRHNRLIYIGVMAVFRQAEQKKWRDIKRAPFEVLTPISDINVVLKKNTVSIR